jgi:peptidoglycan hydrolase-like protein with peptidoglycan-binding domain
MIGLTVAAFAQAQPTTAPGASASATKRTIQGAQERLQALGYQAGSPDGVLGAKTIAALKKFQSDHELSATGVLDRKTLDALNSPNPSKTAKTSTVPEPATQPSGKTAETQIGSPPPKPPAKKRFEDMTAMEVAANPTACGFEKGGSFETTPNAEGLRQGMEPSRDEQWTKETPDGKVYILTIHYDKNNKLVFAKWGGF